MKKWQKEKIKMWEIIQKDDMCDIIHQTLLGINDLESIVVVDLENYCILGLDEMNVLDLADYINNNNAVIMHYTMEDSE